MKTTKSAGPSPAQLARGTIAGAMLAPFVPIAAGACDASNRFQPGWPAESDWFIPVSAGEVARRMSCSNFNASFSCAAKTGVLYGDKDFDAALAQVRQICPGSRLRPAPAARAPLVPYDAPSFLKLHDVALFFAPGGLPADKISALESLAQDVLSARDSRRRSLLVNTFWGCGVASTLLASIVFLFPLPNYSGDARRWATIPVAILGGGALSMVSFLIVRNRL